MPGETRSQLLVTHDTTYRYHRSPRECNWVSLLRVEHRGAHAQLHFSGTIIKPPTFAYRDKRLMIYMTPATSRKAARDQDIIVSDLDMREKKSPALGPVSARSSIQPLFAAPTCPSSLPVSLRKPSADGDDPVTGSVEQHVKSSLKEAEPAIE
jgi:hypothetical protein